MRLTALLSTTTVLALAGLLTLAPLALAQSAPWHVATGGDGTLYLITGAGHYTLSPVQISDDELAIAPDLGVLAGDLPTIAVPPPAPAAIVPAPVVSGDAVSVLDFVAVKGSYGTTVAGTIESHVPDQTLSSVPLQINVFDPSGALVKSETSYVSLDPSQRRGFAKTVFIEKTQAVGNVTVQALTGRASLPISRPALAIDQAEFKPGTYGNKAQAQFHNNSDKDISALLVEIVAFDAGGKVIGGGLAMASAIPAHGVALIEGSLDAPGVPARLEMYPDW